MKSAFDPHSPRAFRARVAAILFLVGLLPAAIPLRAESPAPMKLFIFSGQSNCLGHGDGEKLPEPMKSGDPAVLLFMQGWGFTPEWRTMIPYVTGANLAQMYKTGPTMFGPEIGFGHAMRERFPDRRIGVVKSSVGGTSVLFWSKDFESPEWSAVATAADLKYNPSHNFYTSALLPEVKKAIANAGGSAEVSGFVCVQTEADSGHPATARAWASRVLQLHRDLAADAGYSPDVPLVVMAPHFHIWEQGPSEHAAKILAGFRTAASGGEVDLARLKEACGLGAMSDADFTNELGKMRSFILPDTLRHIEAVGIMQRDLEQLAAKHSNVRIVRSEDLPTYEGLHFTTEGLLELGRRIAGAVGNPPQHPASRDVEPLQGSQRPAVVVSVRQQPTHHAMQQEIWPGAPDRREAW